MTVDPVTIDPQATLREAAELLASEHVSGLPVIAGSELVGVISVTDLMQFDVDRETPSGEFPESSGSEWTLGEEMGLETRGLDAAAGEDEVPAAYFTEMREDVAGDLYDRFGEPDEEERRHDLEAHRVAEVMTRDVLALPPETDVRDAARQMLRADVHRVLVVEDGRLRGVVSTTDMMKAVAQHGLAG